MRVIDSTGWIEYFIAGPHADEYEEYLDDLSTIYTPTIILYEVYKKVKKEKGEENALIAISQLMKTRTVPLDSNLALLAADFSVRHSLPMADAIVYATTIEKNCTLITSDEHFAALDRVIYVPK
ncbi:MAG: type II toxin-antitoxin system VapC family toxin [Candidatus Eremiobacteraeota bacterium]|nr:type II toxin-antitoxin system VapC family toxin [Candidatus Eremiobacteraeota bacterium]